MHLLPDEAPNTGDATHLARWRCSGWAATFVAGLELAEQGTVAMGAGGRI